MKRGDGFGFSTTARCSTEGAGCTCKWNERTSPPSEVTYLFYFEDVTEDTEPSWSASDVAWAKSYCDMEENPTFECFGAAKDVQ